MRSLKELMDMQGCVAVITGGAGHIGLAAGKALVELGATIVVLDLEPQGASVAAQNSRTRFTSVTGLVRRSNVWRPRKI